MGSVSEEVIMSCFMCNHSSIGIPGVIFQTCRMWTLPYATALLSFLVLLLFGMSPAQAEDVRRLHGVVYLGDIPTLVASERGYFSGQGLDLDVHFGDSGKDNLELLRAGKTDFALMAVTPLVLDAVAREYAGDPNDPQVIASISHSIGLNFVVTRAGNGIEHPVDLEGSRIALVRGTNAELLLHFFLEYYGLSVDQVRLVYLPVAEVFEAVAANEVDAAVLWEPWATRLDARLGEPQQRFEVSNVYTARWLLVGRREIVQQSAQAAEQVLQAYAEAIRHIDAYPEDAISLYARHHGVEAEDVAVRWHNFIYGLSLNWSLVTALQQQAEWARDAGYATPQVQFRPLRLVDPRPLNAVQPAAISLLGTVLQDPDS